MGWAPSGRMTSWSAHRTRKTHARSCTNPDELRMPPTESQRPPGCSFGRQAVAARTASSRAIAPTSAAEPRGAPPIGPGRAPPRLYRASDASPAGTVATRLDARVGQASRGSSTPTPSLRLPPRLRPRTSKTLQLAQRGRVDEAVPRLSVRFAHLGSLPVQFFTGRLTLRSAAQSVMPHDRPPCLDSAPSSV
jgi:hypothetical protein